MFRILENRNFDENQDMEEPLGLETENDGQEQEDENSMDIGQSFKHLFIY